MADITPSPAADGPFSLVTEESKKALQTSSCPKNPLISQLLAEGKTPTEIMQAFANAAGYLPDV
jgi:hypothetical protein